MSVSEFSSIFKRRIRESKKLFKIRVDKKGKEYLTGGLLAGSEAEIKSLREKFKAGKRNNIILTRQGFQDILSLGLTSSGGFETYVNYILGKAGKLTNYEESSTSAKSINKNLSFGVEAHNSPSARDPWVILKNIPYDNLSKWSKEFFISQGNNSSDVLELFKKIETGHTVGLFSYRTMVTFGSTIGADGRVNLRSASQDLEFLDRITQLLIDLDIATTNSSTYDMGIYGNTVKDAKRGIMNVELQLATNNQKSADAIKGISKALSDLVFAMKTTGNTVRELEKLKGILSSGNIFNFATDTFTKVSFDAATKNLNELINMKGSPSFVDLIEMRLLAELDPKIGTRSLKSSTTKVKLDSITLDPLSDDIKSSLRSMTSSLKKQVDEQKKLLKALNKAKGLRTVKGQFISPVSIKNLLNASLARQIQQNMGKGRATQVLNYRSGRFANSAEVTQVTNRGGAITAFYSYMKNPYETFAPGGAQGSPASRDPNKLIQTSIRQIATTIMKDRLKVVPV
jgi:hypothetical protein